MAIPNCCIVNETRMKPSSLW